MIKFFSEMFRGRSGKPNSKIFWGSIFALAMVVGLFTNADSTLYKIIAVCMLTLFGYTCYDNKSATKAK